MAKQIRIIYEDFVSKKTSSNRGAKNEFIPEIKDALVPFSDQNSVWQSVSTYEENFDAFVQDAFECGFIYVTPEVAISILQIKKFEMYNPENTKPKKKQTSRRRQGKPKSKPQSERTDHDLVADKV